jgi:hypothetical protein
LDDATSIQATISVVCEHLLHRRLEPKKAGIVLYAMQVASSNLSRMNMNEDTNQRKNGEGNSANLLESPPPGQAPSDTSRAGQDTSAATPSDDPDRLPPGTIQACQQRKRSAV